MKKCAWVISGILLPYMCFAQGGFADEIKSLHSVLEQLYDDMLPLCSQLIGVGRGIAGFAALWYIASRVWRHIANSEPIDFYPLFRPFVLGFAILIFPSVIALINGVMKPTVTGTAAMVENSNKSIEALLKMKEEAIKKTSVWQMYVGETGSGDLINGISILTRGAIHPMRESSKVLAMTSSLPWQRRAIIFAMP